MSHEPVTQRAAALHQEALVVDMTLPFMYGERARQLETLERCRRSGVNFVSLTLAVDWHDTLAAVRAIARERALIAWRDDLLLVETADDIELAQREGKLAVGFHFQGTNPLQTDIRLVDVFYKLGVRHMLIAYNIRNPAGDGCFEPDDGGLSIFGRQLVREMNRVGMLVDASHTGHHTAMDLFEESSDPVIFSHANPRAVWDNPRNIPDDLIRACADTGGVVGITGLGVFLGENDTATTTFLRHIDHVAGLVGPRHVGLGLDYVYDQAALVADFMSNPAWVPDPRLSGSYGFNDIQHVPPEQLPEITEALLAQGYSEEDVRGILGANWLRVVRQVWKPPM